MSDIPASPRWQAVPPRHRRVLGVLVEKAKTTPDAYPLTLNGLTTGCNQKNNRDPQMNLEPDDVEMCLDDLRHMGAVAEVAGSGRVNKYRHLLYDWLGVDKVELAVMGELLLRGAQTVGELRGRAARMEPIADLNSLRPVLQSLVTKQLVLELSPEGRGQLVTHNLYEADELARVKAKAASVAASVSESPGGGATRATHLTPSGREQVTAVAGAGIDAELQWLRQEITDLRTELTRLQQDVRDLWKSLS